MRILILAVALLVAACVAPRGAILPAQRGLTAVPGGETLEAAAYNVYFGNLHSHTSYSDGSGTPDQAYRYARDQAGLDFLAITEHNHRRIQSTGGPIALHPELYAELIRTADMYDRDGSFVALYGQEFSTISSGNHSNILLIEDVIDDQQVPNGDYGTLLRDWLPAHPDRFGQPPLMLLNHPTISGSANDKGVWSGRLSFPRDLA